MIVGIILTTSHTADWHIEDQIILARIRGEVRINDFRELVQQEVDLIESTPATGIHLITDVSEMVKFNLQIFETNHLAEPILKHPKLGWIAVIDPQMRHITRFITNAATLLTNRRYRIFTYLDEAVDFLKSQI